MRAKLEDIYEDHPRHCAGLLLGKFGAMVFLPVFQKRMAGNRETDFVRCGCLPRPF